MQDQLSSEDALESDPNRQRSVMGFMKNMLGRDMLSRGGDHEETSEPPPKKGKEEV